VYLIASLLIFQIGFLGIIYWIEDFDEDDPEDHTTEDAIDNYETVDLMYIGLTMILAIIIHSFFRYISEVKNSKKLAFGGLLILDFLMFALTIAAN
jgi:hypothetical protein